VSAALANMQQKRENCAELIQLLKLELAVLTENGLDIQSVKNSADWTEVCAMMEEDMYTDWM